MSMIGSTNGWIDLFEQMLPELLELVIDAWQSLSPPFTSDKEDAITTHLCKALRKDKKIRELPFMVSYQWAEIDPAPGQKQGRLDIAFHVQDKGIPNENIYLGLECKRLNFTSGKKKRGGGAEYVKDGMMRFVNKQYAKAVKHGGMVGYVLDGNVSEAIKNVEANIKKQCVPLCMDATGTLDPSSILIYVSTARESSHHRNGETAPFRIHHIFLEADNLFK